MQGEVRVSKHIQMSSAVCVWGGGGVDALNSIIERLSVSDETSFLESRLNFVY
jgi:hypothetical protein